MVWMQTRSAHINSHMNCEWIIWELNENEIIFNGVIKCIINDTQKNSLLFNGTKFTYKSYFPQAGIKSKYQWFIGTLSQKLMTHERHKCLNFGNTIMLLKTYILFPQSTMCKDYLVPQWNTKHTVINYLWSIPNCQRSVSNTCNELKKEVHNSPHQIVKWHIKQKKITLVKEIQQWYSGFADNILNY